MIRLLRVDDRLLHGQVAFIWTASLKIDLLLIANNDVACDDFLKMTLTLGKPHGVDLLIAEIDEAYEILKNKKYNDKNTLLIVNQIQDAQKLIEVCNGITSINLGGLRMKKGASMITHAVALTDPEIRMCKEMIDKGIELELRQVPNEKKVILSDLLN
jgi:fructoselysine/glucoselysine PTS system EIIB component